MKKYYTIKLQNLHESADEPFLFREIVRRHEPDSNRVLIRIVRDENGNPRGEAFMNFLRPEIAENIFRELLHNGYLIHRKLMIGILASHDPSFPSQEDMLVYARKEAERRTNLKRQREKLENLPPPYGNRPFRRPAFPHHRRPHPIVGRPGPHPPHHHQPRYLPPPNIPHFPGRRVHPAANHHHVPPPTMTMPPGPPNPNIQHPVPTPIQPTKPVPVPSRSEGNFVSSKYVVSSSSGKSRTTTNQVQYGQAGRGQRPPNFQPPPQMFNPPQVSAPTMTHPNPPTMTGRPRIVGLLEEPNYMKPLSSQHQQHHHQRPQPSPLHPHEYYTSKKVVRTVPTEISTTTTNPNIDGSSKAAGNMDLSSQISSLTSQPMDLIGALAEEYKKDNQSFFEDKKKESSVEVEEKKEEVKVEEEDDDKEEKEKEEDDESLRKRKKEEMIYEEQRRMDRRTNRRRREYRTKDGVHLNVTRVNTQSSDYLGRSIRGYLDELWIKDIQTRKRLTTYFFNLIIQDFEWKRNPNEITSRETQERIYFNDLIRNKFEKCRPRIWEIIDMEKVKHSSKDQMIEELKDDVKQKEKTIQMLKRQLQQQQKQEKKEEEAPVQEEEEKDDDDDEPKETVGEKLLKEEKNGEEE